MVKILGNSRLKGSATGTAKISRSRAFDHPSRPFRRGNSKFAGLETTEEHWERPLESTEDTYKHTLSGPTP